MAINRKGNIIMAITKEQKLQRKSFIGSSDIAALFTDNEGKSLDPFRNAVDVWASKVYDKEEDANDETEAMDRGNRYEPVLIEFARQKLGCTIITNPRYMRFVCEEHPIFGCALDGLKVTEYENMQEFNDNYKADNEIVEAKTTGLTDKWGEPGTDEVPHHVNLQVQHQMLCTGYKKAYIAVLLGKWGLTEEMYIVERNEAIINAIIKRGEQFWNDHVITKTPPAETGLGRIDSFKFIKRVPGKYASINTKFVYDWERRQIERKIAENKEETALIELLSQLGYADGV